MFKWCQNSLTPVYFGQLLPPSLHALHQMPAALYLWSYLLYRCILRVIFFSLHMKMFKIQNSWIKIKVYLMKSINEKKYPNYQKYFTFYSWPGTCKCIFITEIKETGIHCEISSPIWYIFYLQPDKKAR